MKHLPKHIRPRWRYLAVEIDAPIDASFDRGDFQRELWYSAGNLLGDPGSADADLTVYTFSVTDGRGEAIVRTRREETGSARAAIACVHAIDGTPVGVRVRGISGTVRACEERYLGRATGEIYENEVAFGGDRRHADRRSDELAIHLPTATVCATQLDIE